MKSNKFYEDLMVSNFFMFRTNNLYQFEDFENVPN